MALMQRIKQPKVALAHQAVKIRSRQLWWNLHGMLLLPNVSPIRLLTWPCSTRTLPHHARSARESLHPRRRAQALMMRAEKCMFAAGLLLALAASAAHARPLDTAVRGDAGASPPWFCHDLECPKFKVVENMTDIGIEHRQYPAGVG